jgi:hypothetical protein
VCLSIPAATLECLNQPVFVKLGVYIMPPEPISTAYLINPSHQSVCISPIVARQQLGKNFTAATNTRATMEELLVASFSKLSVSYQRKVGQYLFPNFLDFNIKACDLYSDHSAQKVMPFLIINSPYCKPS